MVFRIQVPLVEGMEIGEDIDAWAHELAAEARRDRASAEANRAEGVTVLPLKLQAEDVVGEPPDHDLCVELLERSLRRLEPPAGLPLVA